MLIKGSSRCSYRQSSSTCRHNKYVCFFPPHHRQRRPSASTDAIAPCPLSSIAPAQHKRSAPRLSWLSSPARRHSVIVVVMSLLLSQVRSGTCDITRPAVYYCKSLGLAHISELEDMRSDSTSCQHQEPHQQEQLHPEQQAKVEAVQTICIVLLAYCTFKLLALLTVA